MDVAPIERVAEQGGDQPLVHTFAHTPRPPFPSPRQHVEEVRNASRRHPAGLLREARAAAHAKASARAVVHARTRAAVIRQACEAQKETFDQVTRDRYCND